MDAASLAIGLSVGFVAAAVLGLLLLSRTSLLNSFVHSKMARLYDFPDIPLRWGDREIHAHSFDTMKHDGLWRCSICGKIKTQKG